VSYTAQTLALAAAEQLRASGINVYPSTVPRLVVLVPSALRKLPVKVRERFGPREAEVYRKNYTVALTDGQGSLAAHTDLTSEPMVVSDIAKVTHPDVATEENTEGRLQFAGSRSALSQGRDEFPSYAVEDNTLYTLFDGDTEALDGNATVRAGFVPLITSVKTSHEPLLLECLVELVKGQEVETA
jgi:hypothetical protein